MSAVAPTEIEIDYPDSDGLPMSDNMLQYCWMTRLKGNLDSVFRHRPDVLVAGDNLWYPVEGNDKIRLAPDVYVVFGRPKGHRGSYRQWVEDGVPLTVVFEVLAPGNTASEMAKKWEFYDEYGVEEYYVYDPDANKLDIRVRGAQTLYRVHDIANFVSPRLGIRFEMTKPEMTVYGPDRVRFGDCLDELASPLALALEERRCVETFEEVGGGDHADLLARLQGHLDHARCVEVLGVIETPLPFAVVFECVPPVGVVSEARPRYV